MKFTTTTTSKGQLTIPKRVREKLGLEKGVKVDIYPIDDGFIGKPRKKSRILDLIGDLEYLDKGEPFSEIRLKTQKAAAKEIIGRIKTNENSRD